MRYKLKCIKCSYESEFSISFHCPRCGGILTLDYEKPVFQIDKSKPGIWRYYSLLPSFTKLVSLGEGLTPITKLNSVLIKNERFNPTGSYTDRASSVIASYLAEIGARSIIVNYVEDYTKSLIYYLKNLSVDIDVYTYSISSVDTGDLLLFINSGVGVVTEKTSSKLVVDYFNPLTIEGLKTIVFEIFERRVSVEYIVVPTETGLLALSLYKGLLDLKEAGVDVDYEIVAVVFKDKNVPLLKDLKTTSIRVVSVSEEEALESFKKLVERGFRTKLLAAICYSIAESIGNSIAIVTAGYKPQGAGKTSSVKKIVREVLSEKPYLSAYMIWREKPIYSLRAFYKAIKDMEVKREICFETVSKGRRRVKLYRLC